MYDKEQVLNYWEDQNVESMYDKHLLEREIEMIKKYLAKGIKVLDVGCGEGEATKVYSSIKGIKIHAIDFSNTRLMKAKERMRDKNNVVFKQIDLTSNDYQLDNDYDEKRDAEFIKSFYKEWQDIKKKFDKIMNGMEASWEKKAEKKDKGYLG